MKKDDEIRNIPCLKGFDRERLQSYQDRVDLDLLITECNYPMILLEQLMTCKF
jgi:hypothetical protein